MGPNFLDVLEPHRPFFEIWVEHDKLADLIEPADEEMFWCSYKLIPVCPAAEQRLREQNLWNDCNFEIRSPVTGQVVGIPLAGGSSFKEYCKGKTGRIDFRSLWPGLDRCPNPPYWYKFRKWLRSFWRRGERNG